jgi:coenzyme F420-reducing hydrogenase alpha subunit
MGIPLVGDNLARKMPEGTAPQWKKGQSGNPGGFNRQISRMVRELVHQQTDDCTELVEFALNMMRDREEHARDRLRAHEWLTKFAGLTENLDVVASAKDANTIIEAIRVKVLSDGLELVEHREKEAAPATENSEPDPPQGG